MAFATAKTISHEALLETLRAEVERVGGERLTMDRFLANSGLREHDVFCHYPRWNEALRAAGCENLKEPIESELMLADWGDVARKMGCIPTINLYKLHGKYDESTVGRRFGRWSGIRGAFQRFAEGKEEWADVAAMVERGMKGDRQWVTAQQRRRDGVSFGEPLSLAGLRNAPVNENGVIFLFGVLAERLGFSVEAVRPAFPDCVAKRRVGPLSTGSGRAEEWRNVRIEFEYESRNFRDHGHPAEECDMIVCWAHNWAECPPELEVIALKEEVGRLRRE